MKLMRLLPIVCLLPFAAQAASFQVDCCVSTTAVIPSDPPSSGFWFFPFGGIFTTNGETDFHFDISWVNFPADSTPLPFDPNDPRGQGFRINFDNSVSIVGRVDEPFSGFGQLGTGNGATGFDANSSDFDFNWTGLFADITSPRFRLNTDNQLLATFRLHGPMDMYENQIGSIFENADAGHPNGERIQINCFTTPEPATWGMLLTGLAVLAIKLRKAAPIE